MTESLFTSRKELTVRAFFFGQRLELRNFKYSHKLCSLPLTVPSGKAGYAVLFRYGVVVLLGLEPLEEANFLEEIRPFIVEPFAEPETETVELIKNEQVQESIENSTIYLHDFDLDRLILVSGILAKSVVLAHYEHDVAESFDLIEPLATSLKERGRGRRSAKELLKHIGDILYIQGKMVGRVEVMEKPEILWEHPELERLYLRLEDEFELHERHVALERKLDLISRTAETLLDLLQTNRSLRVEWYIVILIVVEVLMSLHDKFFPAG